MTKSSEKKIFLDEERNILAEERTILAHIRTELAFFGMVILILTLYFNEFLWDTSRDCFICYWGDNGN